MVVCFVKWIMRLLVFCFFLLKLMMKFVMGCRLVLMILLMEFVRELWVFWNFLVNFKFFLLGVLMFKKIVLK